MRYVVYGAALRGTSHWNANSARCRAKDVRAFIGGLFDRTDAAHGWRVRRAILTLDGGR